MSRGQAAAQSRLDAIMADKSHPDHDTYHPRAQAATEEVLALRHTALGEASHRLIGYREPGDSTTPRAGPPAALVTHKDLLQFTLADLALVARAAPAGGRGQILARCKATPGRRTSARESQPH
jgi:hypothetical protein